MAKLSNVWLFATTWTQHTRFPHPQLSPRVCSNSVMLCNHLIFCHSLLLLPSIVPRSGSFPMRWLCTSDGQSVEASALASVLPMTYLIFLKSKGHSGVFFSTTIQKTSIIECSVFVMDQLSHSYMTPGLNHSFAYMDICLQSNVLILICCVF